MTLRRPFLEVAAPARSRTRRPVLLNLDDIERALLLHRLADVAGTAEAILHRPPPPGEHVARWQRAQVIARVVSLVAVLRHGRPLLVLSDIDRAVLIEGIEGNRWALALPAADIPLLRAAAQRADALRLKLSRAIDRPIGRMALPARATV
ncbi:MAG TPA: hypothetical protein VK741_25760 [Acetobacteraceae bacterium]|jgi:hypothetical protein|nr:hypothetical protein [Acetobacteraceae bacterium]